MAQMIIDTTPRPAVRIKTNLQPQMPSMAVTSAETMMGARRPEIAPAVFPIVLIVEENLGETSRKAQLIPEAPAPKKKRAKTMKAKAASAGSLGRRRGEGGGEGGRLTAVVQEATDHK
jgi:hypothetical protein